MNHPNKNYPNTIAPMGDRFTSDTITKVTEYIFQHSEVSFNEGEKEMMLQWVQQGATLEYKPDSDDDNKHTKIEWEYIDRRGNKIRFAFALFSDDNPMWLCMGYDTYMQYDDAYRISTVDPQERHYDFETFDSKTIDYEDDLITTCLAQSMREEIEFKYEQWLVWAEE